MRAYFRDIRKFASDFCLGGGMMVVNGALLVCAVMVFPIMLAVEVSVAFCEAWCADNER